MLRIDKSEKKLVRLAKSGLADADHWERELQSMICSDPDSFCEELGEELLVIGQEVRPSEAISDRIDILAVDEGGSSVVIELKRGTHKFQLLQAISYAGMVSHWSADRFVECLASTHSQSVDDARTAIEDHTGLDLSSINHAQRILLIAEDFDPALLMATEWLHESCGVDIRCYRLQLSQENGTDYLTCVCIYPPLEIATLTRGSDKKSGQASPGWTSWEMALETVENQSVADFFRAELEKHQESRLSSRELIYRIGGKRRFWLSPRKKYAYVFQGSRFEGDEEFWRKILSEPGHVQQVREKHALRFRLTNAADFSAFAAAAKKELTKMVFADGSDVHEVLADDEN